MRNHTLLKTKLLMASWEALDKYIIVIQGINSQTNFHNGQVSLPHTPQNILQIWIQMCVLSYSILETNFANGILLKKTHFSPGKTISVNFAILRFSEIFSNMKQDKNFKFGTLRDKVLGKINAWLFLCMYVAPSFLVMTLRHTIDTFLVISRVFRKYLAVISTSIWNNRIPNPFPISPESDISKSSHCR